MSDFNIPISVTLNTSGAMADWESFVRQIQSKNITTNLDTNLSQALVNQDKVFRGLSRQYASQWNVSNKQAEKAIRQSYKLRENYEARYQKKLAQIQYNATTSKYLAQATTARSQISKYYTGSSSTAPKMYKQALSQVENIEKTSKIIEDYYNGVNTNNLDDSKILKMNKDLLKMQDAFNNQMSIIRANGDKLLDSSANYKWQSKISSYMKANTKLKSSASLWNEVNNLLSEAGVIQNVAQEKELNTKFNALKSKAETRGLTGLSLGDSVKRGFKQIFQFAGTYGIIQSGMNELRESFAEIKDIDDIITEISKVSDMSDSELKQLSNDSFEQASKYGKKASDYLYGVQEMNRAGYQGEQGKQMAELSTLAQSAGDMSSDVANEYLLATDAAFKYKGEVTKLNAVLDGQNMITNLNAVSMTDMAAATTKMASIASQLGVKENEVSAIIGTAQAVTQRGGEEVGTAWKSIMANLTNTNSSKIVNTYSKLGIAMTEMVDGSEKVKTPIELLKELADVVGQLDDGDALKQEALLNFGGKYHMNQLSAVISNWDMYEKMLQDYESGTGSAEREAEKSANNMSGSLNRLSNTFTDTVSNVADSGAITGTINMFDTLLSGVNKLTDAFGTLGTIGAGLGIAGFLRSGKPYRFRLCH